MANVQETIPDGLSAEVAAALAWFNETQDIEFSVTGIVDADEALAASGSKELRLVLCGGDRCEQRSFRVAVAKGEFDVEPLEADSPAPGATPPELDPPPGVHRGWLDRTLDKHAFVVLLFYRGFW